MVKTLMRNWFSGRSIKSQLVVLLFGLTAISVVAISSLGVTSVLDSGKKAESITSDAMQQRVEQFLVQTTKAAAEKNSQIFQRIVAESNDQTALASTIYNNPSMYPKSGWNYDDHVTHQPDGKYTNSTSEPGSVYIPGSLTVTPAMKQELNLSTYLDQPSLALLANEPNAVATYFIGTQGETKYYPNIGLGSIVPVGYTPVGDVFFTPATPTNDPDKTLKWSVLYDDPAGNGLMISAANPIYTQNTFFGLIGIDVTLNKIAANIESYTPITSSYAFLIDKGGRAIALPAQGYQDILGRSQKKGEFGADLTGVKGDFGTVLTNMRQGSSGFSKVTTKHSALFVAYAPVEGTSFSLGIAAKQSALLTVVGNLQNQVKSSTNQMVYGRVLPIGLGLLAVVWLYGFIYIRRFTEPLNKLTAKTAQLAGGNFDVEPEVVAGDNEIGQLARSFNNMVADLKASHSKIEAQNKELVYEQARLTASIKSLPFGFAIINPDNEIVFRNSVLANLFDRPIPTGAASRAVLEKINTDFKAGLDILKCIATSRSSRQPMEQNVELGPRFYRFFFVPIIDDSEAVEQVIGTVLIMEDTTEDRAMQRSRDEFFSIASHELRTPLAAIRGNASMILKYYEDAVKDPALHELVDDIQESSVRLITIVNDFLDASRLEQGKLVFKLEPFDIVALGKEVLHDLDASDSQRKVALELEADGAVMVLGDGDRTRQILMNLVGNALKFTDNGSIRLDITKKAGTVTVTVTDTGKGIPVESQHLLFHKFQQASNNILTRDNTRSTGLGLYISKLMAEAMNGRLYLEHTEVGKGSTFALELPEANGKVAHVKPAVKPTEDHT